MSVKTNDQFWGDIRETVGSRCVRIVPFPVGAKHHGRSNRYDSVRFNLIECDNQIDTMLFDSIQPTEHLSKVSSPPWPIDSISHYSNRYDLAIRFSSTAFDVTI